MLGWDRYGFPITRARTRYSELVFLQSVGSVFDIVGTDCTKSVLEHANPKLCFSIRWDLWVA
jgi:hypothetical protein